MALAFRRTVLAAVLIAGLGTAVAAPVATVRHTPTLCVALGDAVAPLIAVGELPASVVQAAVVEAPLPGVARVEAPAAPPARLANASVLTVAPKTSPPGLARS